MKYDNHKRINIFLLLTITLYSLFCIVSVVKAAGVIPEMDLITSYSSTGGTPQHKDNDQDLIYKVEQGDEISFTITTSQSDLNYLWEVKQGSQVISSSTEGTTFNWTVPSEQSTWEIEIEVTLKDEIGNTIGRDCLSWTITTSDLITVNPGESIQTAINNLPAEGGVVELAPGVHDVYDTIVINKSNVTIQGTHESEIRGHDSGSEADIFVIPHENPTYDEDWENMPTLENITFKGFKFTTAYETRGGRALVHAWQTKNLTMEDILSDSHIMMFLVTNPYGGWTDAHSDGIFVRNNTIYRSNVVTCFSEDIYVEDNTILNCFMSWALDIQPRNSRPIYITGNYVTGGANGNIRLHGASHVHIWNNTLAGNSQHCIYAAQGGSYSIIENNTLTGASISAIIIEPQYDIVDLVIRNNRIYNNNIGIKTLECFGFRGWDSYVDVINNVICNNIGDGILMTSEYIQLKNIKNNIIVNNGGYGINYMDTVNPTTIKYNDVWQNALGNYNGISSGTGDISVDPRFADPANYDFHLKSTAGRWNGTDWVNDNVTSPCIDAGDPSEKDPDGTRINMGAYGGTSEASKSPSAATGTLSGKVTDKDTGLPIEGAIVTANSYQTTTNSTGDYILSLPAENYTLTASKTGYYSSSTMVQVLENQTTTLNFQLLAEDTIPPEISNVNATSITPTTAVITWETDEKATSLVEYGTTSGSYPYSKEDTSYTTSHSITLTDLQPNTTYYFVVNSKDKAENPAQSPEYSFNTPTLSTIKGDINGDGKVNSLDYSLLVAKWFKTTDITQEDLNKDGIVNVRDLGILMSNWKE